MSDFSDFSDFAADFSDDDSVALSVRVANAREVIATAAPLSAPTNRTQAVTSTMTVRSVCLKRSELGTVLLI